MAEFVVNLSDVGFDEFYKSLRQKSDIVGRKLPKRTVANVAAIGRRKAEKQVTGRIFNMGVKQTTWKSSKKEHREGVFTEWSESVGGWVSRGYKTNQGNFRMGNFSFEGVKAQTRSGGIKYAAFAKARYTNQLINAHERAAKFSKNSPFVGSLGKVRQWKAGEVRSAKPALAATAAIMRGSMPEAIKRAEREFEGEISK